MVFARTMKRGKRIAAVVATISIGTVMAGCQRDAAPDAAAQVKASAAQSAFQAEQDAWRQQRREQLLQPDGWTSLIALHWLEYRAHYVGSSPDNGVRLALGPPELGIVRLERDGSASFAPARGVQATVDGQPITGQAALRSDANGQTASVVGFDEGKGHAMVIKRGDRYALRVKHADAITRTKFANLDYWPADPAWRVQARFVAHPPGRTLPIANIIGTVDAMPNPGVVEFERDGETYRLEALDQGDGGLFLIFADRSNGRGSYSAGRFLDAPLPAADGSVVLDFNRAYNPPCVFTAYATCPLPPNENRLNLAIEAGEKNYLKPKS